MGEENCLRCHKPFSEGRTATGGWSEARILHDGVGPYHAECSRLELGEQSEIERLRAVLTEIANYPGAPNDDAEPLREIARAALADR